MDSDSAADRMERIQELFLKAMELEPGERARFLEECSREDAALRSEVEELLRVEVDSSEFLKKPLFSGSEALLEKCLPPQANAESGRRIGRFLIEKILGEGGMGVVYRAMQDHPRRAVALKVLRPGSCTERSLRRFEFEAQVLAQLHHPGIAQIYEIGSTETSLGPEPWLAMELVDGEPLNTYAVRKGLSRRERLELWCKICDAVHHAHQKGIIHRDLKPPNILVEESGQPKILDFGIARAAEGELSGQTPHTLTGQILGTIGYMSPEQFGGDPAALDTRSDVYALGVIGYELLTGSLPYSYGADAALPEVIRSIRELDPVRPSLLDRTLRGDVETILGKALEKERDRRYDSAAALVADVRRFLRDEPISARPASAVYQLTKFTRRNRTVVLATVAIFTVLIGALFSISNKARVARAEERNAELQAQIAEAVNLFFDQVLSSLTPGNSMGREVTVRQVLDEAARSIEATFQGPDEVRAAIEARIGNTYHALSFYREADPHLQKALEIFTRQRGERDAKSLALQAALAAQELQQGRYAPAKEILERVLDPKQKGLPDTELAYWRALSDLAVAHKGLREFDQAEELYLKALDGQTRLFGPNQADTVTTRQSLAVLYEITNREEEAETLYREILMASKGEEHPKYLSVSYGLAHLLETRGRREDAEVLYREILEQARRLLGAHQYSFVIMFRLAESLVSSDQLSEALVLHQEAYQGRKKLLGPAHPGVFASSLALGKLYHDLARYEEARSCCTEATEMRRTEFEEGDAEAVLANHYLAKSLDALGFIDEARTLHEEVLRRSVKVQNPSSPITAEYRLAYGKNLMEMEEPLAAEEALLAALQAFRGSLGIRNKLAQDTLNTLIELYESISEPEKAEPLREQLLDDSEREDETPSSQDSG